MSYPMCLNESSSLQYNFFMAFTAAKRASHLRSNNTGPAADPKITSEEKWLELTRCIDPRVPDSVRSRWLESCSDLRSEACVKSLAQLAQEKGCGNCQEKASVALMWLKGEGVRPLDLMELVTHHNIDHVFVVIGRRRGSDADNPWTWGPDAVVCDPWHDGGKAYYAANLQTSLYRGHGPTWFGGTLRPQSVFRIE
jgi:hypothetical protein